MLADHVYVLESALDVIAPVDAVGTAEVVKSISDVTGSSDGVSCRNTKPEALLF